jgi:hypothetical protein
MRTQAITDTVAPIAQDTGASRNRFIELVNMGPNTVYLKFDGSATALTSANGSPLAKDGRATFAPDDVGLFGPISGVCATGETATLRIQEQNFQLPA